MWAYLKLYAITFAAFFVIDMVWLGLVAKGFYRKHLGYLMAPEVNWPAAIIFYMLFIAGLLVFVVVPGLKAGSLAAMVLRGALFGLITYATYDLTNLATIKNWPLTVTLVDMVWGAVLSTLTSLAGYSAGRWIGLFSR
ncbi:DUF2177 family protein [bacterium]|nr:DUF2177 family protein [bacterium]